MHIFPFLALFLVAADTLPEPKEEMQIQEVKVEETQVSTAQEAVPQIAQKAVQKEVRKKKIEAKAIESFTGKVVKDRVRLRLQPTLDGTILKELPKNSLLVITGVVDEFYAVMPLPQAKGYVFRTYVLDGEVVGNHVNVRLEPDINAHVIHQLNSGDKIAGTPAKGKARWLEIELPDAVRFYVAKEYISKMGPESLFYSLEKRRNELEQKLDVVEVAIQEEMKKSFQEIQLSLLSKELQGAIAQASEFPEQSERASVLLKKMQESYLEKSVSHAEVKKVEVASHVEEKKAEPILAKKEEAAVSLTDTLKGIVKPYVGNSKLAPGEFLLVNGNGSPVGFLSSREVNLMNFVGKEVTVTVVSKANNNFAYPAYQVVKIQ